MILPPKLILASGSPRRLALLNQAGIEPDHLLPTDVDEQPRKAEHPRTLARRLCREKAEAARKTLKGDPNWPNRYILAADTVVAVGRRILDKAEMITDASNALYYLSGRTHRVYTGICLVTPNDGFRQKLVETRVRFKRLSRTEVESYLASGQWRGKAGGYAIQGLAGSFVVKIIGSYSNVVGLPVQETVNMLVGEGYDVYAGWLQAGQET
ncbi:MAG: Maf-like protein [Pseudomonadota bacterium]